MMPSIAINPSGVRVMFRASTTPMSPSGAVNRAINMRAIFFNWNMRIVMIAKTIEVDSIAGWQVLTVFFKVFVNFLSLSIAEHARAYISMNANGWHHVAVPNNAFFLTHRNRCDLAERYIGTVSCLDW